MKNLTRIQAWKFIQHKFKEYANGGSEEYGWTDFGLCRAVNFLRRGGFAFSNSVLTRMRREIKSVRPRGACAYYWTLCPDGAKQRVKAISRILKRASRTKAKR